MLIDDEESAVDYLEILLSEMSGIEIVGKYTNPLLALEEFLQVRPDVVFVDVQMPGIQGMELAARMRALVADVGILFTTAYSEYAIDAFEMNATDYLLKPFTKDRLANAVARIQQQTSQNQGSQDPVRSSIQMMGGLYLHAPSIKNGVIPWRTNKVKELCAFMLHHSCKTLKSDEIIEAVWPDSDPVNARAYLYTCLSFLRKNLKEYDMPMEVVKYGNSGYMLTMEDITLDAHIIGELVERRVTDDEQDEQAITRLIELYQGEYLQGCDYEWASPKRDQLYFKAITALQYHYEHFTNKGRQELAEQCLRAILELSPESEREARELMKLYLDRGRRSEALKLYHRLAAEVCDNLGAELEEETISLYQRCIT